MFNVMYDDSLAVVFFEKSNCTQVVATFFERLGLLEEARRYSDWIHDYRINVWLRGRYITLETLQSMKVPKLKFIRNPYQRAMSMYTHFCHEPSAQLPNLSKLPKPTVKQFLQALLKVPHLRGEPGASMPTSAARGWRVKCQACGRKSSMWTVSVVPGSGVD